MCSNKVCIIKFKIWQNNIYECYRIVGKSYIIHISVARLRELLGEKKKMPITRKYVNDVTIFKIYVTISQFQALIFVLLKWKKTISIGQK